MEPLSLHLPQEQNYDCVQCGRSCQAGWDIPVEDAIRERLERHPLTLRVIQEHGAAMVEKKGCYVLNMTPACGYLEADLLCGIHRHIGVEVKPGTCRLFPMIFTRTPEGIYVGASYSCTAVRENSGRSLASQRAEVEALLKIGVTVNQVAADGLVIHGSWFTNYADYCCLEKQIYQRAEIVGIFSAISEALCGLARQVAGWRKPRNSSPRPAPEEICGCFSLEDELLQKLRITMWSELSKYFLPDLEGVEPATRADYQRVTTSLSRLEEVQPLHTPAVERYLRHLLFRKQLVIHPTILSNLCLLDFLPGFLALYGHGFARLRGRELQDQDYWDALDLAEKFLVYHCRGLRPVYQRCARLFVEQFKEVV